MEDVITFLQFLQKLEQGRLIPTEQIEHLSDILKSTLRKNLCNGVYDSLEELLESQLNGNEHNPLFIDILETTPKHKEKDTLTKITEFLDDLYKDYPSNQLGFKYNLNFKVPSQDVDYIEIFKDPDQGYILKYTSYYPYEHSRYNSTTPLKYLDNKSLNYIWEAIQERSSNE